MPDLTVRDVASIVGRNQGPEQFFQQAFVALQSPIIPKALNVNRPCERISIVWRGRIVIAGANYTAVAAEAPQTLLQRVRLTGTHAKYGSLTPVDLTGATIFALTRLFRQRTSSVYINGVRQGDPSVPFAQVGATFGNIGTYDVEIYYDLPLVPILPPNSLPTLVPFHFMEKDWADTLQLQLFFGDLSSFGTPDALSTVAFTAFGSGAGTPTVTIFQNFAILGPIEDRINSAVVVRSEQTLTAPISAVQNNTRLILLQKQKTTNIIFKTGTLLTGTSPGVSVFATLRDDMLNFTQPIVDNKPIRNNQDNGMEKEYAGYAFDTVLPGGYNNFTFVDSVNPLTYYRGDLLAGGSTFELDTNVVVAPANAAVNVLQEQVVGDPVIA